MTERPSDQAVREAVVLEKARNVIVEASAGTGKTTLLLDRVVEMLRGGARLDRLAVVTFTRAAASELRHRLGLALAEGSSSDPELRRQLQLLPVSLIDTIHGFCSTLLRRYSHLTGVDPSFGVIPSHFTADELQRLWDLYLTRLSADRLRGSSDAVEALGSGGMLGLALAIESAWWIEEESVFGDSAEVFEGFRAATGEAMEAAGRIECLEESDLLFEPRERLLAIARLIAAEEVADPESMLGTVPGSPKGRGKAEAWGGKQNKDLVVRALVCLRDNSLLALGSLRGLEILRQTWALVQPFVSDLRQRWEQDLSRLSYEDLQVRAMRCLRDLPAFRELADEDLAHLLVDEFQDTSMVQVDLLRWLLAAGGDDYPPGRLTVVGDPKQSIYGWRNADMETYAATIAGMRSSGALLGVIEANFRSTRAIVRFVNSFGRALFDLQAPEEREFGCAYSPMAPGPCAAEGEKPVVLMLPQGCSADQLRSLQAAWVADHVQRTVSRGAAGYGDFALLLRTRTGMEAFEGALSARGVPFCAVSGRDFKKRPEIADLREMVRCLLCPDDRLAWVHTLRSLFFGMDDLTLTRALEGGTCGYEAGREADGCPGAVLAANALLRHLRMAACRLPLSDFLFRLLLDTDLLGVIAGTEWETGRRMANIRTLLESALSGEVSDHQALLAMLDSEEKEEALDEPSSAPDEQGAVVISTIHAAKGLTFDRVIVAGIQDEKRGGPTRDGLSTYEHEHIAAITGGEKSFITPHWPRIEEVRKAREAAEHRRLCYVAVTRAAKSLHILGRRPRPDGKGLTGTGRLIWEALERCLSSGDDSFVVEDLPLVEAADRALRRPGPSPPPPAPSAEVGSSFDVARDIEPGIERRPGVRLGLLTHSILERVDLDSPLEWLERQAGDVCAREPEIGPEALQLASGLFAEMSLPFELSSRTVVGREYPVYEAAGGRLDESYVDLLVDTGGRELVALDYKTDDPSAPGSGGLEGIVARYRDRQESYGRLLARGLGRKVRVYLALLRPRELIEIGLF
ncbi:UvrD-helicase domain-containing protein [Candidatus Fermentibacterales bacterium]|nr:UvrD-helicase domain-containing protein [Candidatus Fermentibacterales bacterium]